jgi:hypothetical protein
MHALLKSVFLAVEDFKPEMSRVSRELADRVQGRTGGRPGHVAAARAFLEWLLDDNYVHLGMLRYTMGSDGTLHPTQDVALGAFKDPSLVPTVFPGLPDDIATHLAPAEARRRSHRRHRLLHERGAIHHLEPIDDLVVREWAPTARLAAMTLVLGRLAKSAFTERRRTSRCSARRSPGCSTQRSAPNSHAYREARAIFNHFPKRELFYADAADAQGHHRPDGPHGGRRRDRGGDRARGRGLRRGVGRLLGHALLVQGEEDLKACWPRRSVRSSFNTWADCGTKACWSTTSTGHARAPLDPDRCAISRRARSRRGRTSHGARSSRRSVRSRDGGCSTSTCAREPQRPLPRVDGARGGARGPRRARALEGRLELSVLPGRPTGHAEAVLAQADGLTETLRTLQNLSLRRRRRTEHAARAARGRRAWLERLHIEGAAAQVIAAVTEGATGCSTRCARCTRGVAPTTR